MLPNVQYNNLHCFKIDAIYSIVIRIIGTNELILSSLIFKVRAILELISVQSSLHRRPLLNFLKIVFPEVFSQLFPDFT